MSCSTHDRAPNTTLLCMRITHRLLSDVVQKKSPQRLGLNYAELLSSQSSVDQVYTIAGRRDVIVGWSDRCSSVLVGWCKQ